MMNIKTDVDSLVGVLFVYKKDSRRCLILATRGCNNYFCHAPHVALPTASAVASIDCLPGETTYFSVSDCIIFKDKTISVL